MKRIGSANLHGRVVAPSSKSELLRAITLASLAQGTSRIKANNECEDVNALINSILRSGLPIVVLPDGYWIKGGAWPKHLTIHCGESGYLYRSLPFIASQVCERCELTAEGTLRERQHGALHDLLALSRILHSAENASHSIQIEQSAYPQKMIIPNLDSSQPLSGLLLSLPLGKRRVEVDYAQIDSYGYIEMTIEVMRQFGVKLNRQNDNYVEYDGKQKYSATDYEAEGDWSAASLLMAAAAAQGDITIEGLNPQSKQPDRAIIEALRMANANVVINGDRVRIQGREASVLKPFCFDVNACPDLAPALAILAAKIDGQSAMVGIERLKNKESDRIQSLMALLALYGIACEEKRSALLIKGGTLRCGVEVNPHADHRIAMAGALLATMTHGGECIVHQAQCVNKSYPRFWHDLERLAG